VTMEQGEFLAPGPYAGPETSPSADAISAAETTSPSATPLPYGRGSLRASDQDSAEPLPFHPARYAKTVQNAHENIRDWCISRQLWWGHRIPVWSRRIRLNGSTLIDYMLSYAADNWFEEERAAGIVVDTLTGERLAPDDKTTTDREYD